MKTWAAEWNEENPVGTLIQIKREGLPDLVRRTEGPAKYNGIYSPTLEFELPPQVVSLGAVAVICQDMSPRPPKKEKTKKATVKEGGWKMVGLPREGVRQPDFFEGTSDSKNVAKKRLAESEV